MSPLAAVLLVATSQIAASDAGVELNAGADVEVIALRPGGQKILNFPGVTHVAIGDPKVADVKTLGASQFLLVGLSVGDSGLMLFREGRAPASYTIRVRNSEGCGILEIHELLPRNRKSSVRMVGDRIFIDGEVGSLEELKGLLVLFELYPQVKNLAHLDPKLVQAAADSINDAFVRAGLKDVRAVLSGDDIVLEGAIADDLERRKAQAMADSIFEPIRRGAEALHRAMPAPAAPH
jgi:pilus assembly protein CpaC